MNPWIFAGAFLIAMFVFAATVYAIGSLNKYYKHNRHKFHVTFTPHQIRLIRMAAIYTMQNSDAGFDDRMDLKDIEEKLSDVSGEFLSDTKFRNPEEDSSVKKHYSRYTSYHPHTNFAEEKIHDSEEME